MVQTQFKIQSLLSWARFCKSALQTSKFWAAGSCMCWAEKNDDWPLWIRCVQLPSCLNQYHRTKFIFNPVFPCKDVETGETLCVNPCCLEALPWRETLQYLICSLWSWINQMLIRYDLCFVPIAVLKGRWSGCWMIFLICVKVGWVWVAEARTEPG